MVWYGMYGTVDGWEILHQLEPIDPQYGVVRYGIDYNRFYMEIYRWEHHLVSSDSWDFNGDLMVLLAGMIVTLAMRSLNWSLTGQYLDYNWLLFMGHKPVPSEQFDNL